MTSVQNSSSSSSTKPALHRHVRGDALRRSLYFTFIAWIPGAFWQGATGNTAMTPLGKFLGANDFVFSLIFTAAPLLSVLFQIPGSLAIERARKRKTLFLIAGTPGRALFMLMGLLPWLLPAQRLGSAFALALLVFFAMGLQNFSVQAWVNWMSALVPSRLRGKYFAARSRMGVAIIAITTILVAAILDTGDLPRIAAALAPFHPASMPPLVFLISIVFLAAGAIGTLDILSFTKVIEPPMPPAPAEPLWQKLSAPMRDPQFRRYVTYYSVWQMANCWCSWFWMVYFLDFLTRPEHQAALPSWAKYTYLTASIIQPVGYQIGQFLGYPMWGRAVDRFGRKPVFLVSSSLHTLSWLAWIFLSPALLPWMLPIQIFGGFVGGGQDIAAFNMMLHFNRKGGSGYQAVGSVIFSCAGALAAFAAGSLSTSLVGTHWTFAQGSLWQFTLNRYGILILIGATLKYTSDFVFVPQLQDEAKPAGHALRYMLNNMHDTLDTLIFAPVRSGARVTGTSLRRWWR